MHGSAHAASFSSAARTTPQPVRVGVICDFAEENWPSMDWAAEMLLASFADEDFRAQRFSPAMPRRFRRLPGMRDSRRAFNMDRVLARYRDYPRLLRNAAPSCELFHIADHSYAHLALELLPQCTIVTCHDIDIFRGLLGQRRSSALPARLARRTLRGLQSAARVICVSAATQAELLRHGLLQSRQTIVVPNAIGNEFFFGAREQSQIEALLPGREKFLLHVGSVIPRKRIDLLLRVFSAARVRHPELHLVRVGGEFTAEQQKLARDLRISDAISALPALERAPLAAVYRAASALLMTSDSEGFGLPLAEALACGTPVIATDIPVLREVGGHVARYCALDEIDAWANTVSETLALRSRPEDFTSWQQRALQYAERFRLENFAAAIRAIYHQVLAEAVQ